MEGDEMRILPQGDGLFTLELLLNPGRLRYRWSGLTLDQIVVFADCCESEGCALLADQVRDWLLRFAYVPI